MLYMATKSANLYARIEPDVKEKAESILSTLGIPASSAINMFYKQIILQRGLPFEVKYHLPDLLTSAHYQKQNSMKNWKRICGYAGWTDKNVKKAFADIRNDYGL